jgi:diguanylate cyclase (GGDEF)-like protein
VLCSADLVARLGGDEFIVLIEGPRAAEAAPAIAARIMEALNEAVRVEGQNMTVGASIGISQFPDDSGTAEELLLNADAAMYAAKSGGRCAYMRYQDVLEARRRERVEAHAQAGEGATQGHEAEPTA